jgi:hypothetical protein
LTARGTDGGRAGENVEVPCAVVARSVPISAPSMERNIVTRMMKVGDKVAAFWECAMVVGSYIQIYR